MRHLDYPPVLACGADTHTHLLAFGIFCCFCMEQHKTIPSLLFERHLGGEYASYVGPYVSLIAECVSWSCAAEVLSRRSSSLYAAPRQLMCLVRRSKLGIQLGLIVTPPFSCNWYLGQVVNACSVVCSRCCAPLGRRAEPSRVS